MWCCDNCREDFYKPEQTMTTYEKYYGVSGEFNSHHFVVVSVCPYCGSDEINEYDEEEEDEK